MGRTIITEKSIEDFIDNMYGTVQWQIGLIIGQLTKQKDFIIHLARTPDPVEDEAEIENCQDDETEPPKQESKKKNQQILSPTDDINEKWISEHARQVNRMLPGGIHIIGIYMLSTPDLINKNQTKLRQCINLMHKVTERIPMMRNFMAHNNRILLHICASSRKVTCRTMDITDTQMQLSPAEFKYQNFLNKWNSVKCIADVDLRFSIPVTSEKSRFESLIFQGLENQLEEIVKSIPVINGTSVNEDEQLFEPAKAPKGKTKKDESKSLDINFFSCKKCDSEEKFEKQCSRGVIKFIGKSYCQAFLCTKCTKGEAVRALKGDIIRSILSRIELLCEEAEVNNLYQVDDWSLVSPTRVFAKFRNTPLDFCDYFFKDEESKETQGRFSELLSISVAEESLLYHEKFPDTDMAAQMTVESGHSSSNEDPSEQATVEDKDENSNMLVCLIGILVALVSALIALLMST